MSRSLVRQPSPAGEVSLAPLEGLVTLTPTSLSINDPDLEAGDWLGLVATLARARSGASWWLGDALAFGERKYGKTYAVAADETGLSVRTLRNLASVSRRVVPSRRVADLPWRAHRAVAHLRASEQRLWLRRARDFGWKSDELGEQMTLAEASGAKGPEALPKPSRHVDLRCPKCGYGLREEDLQRQTGEDL